MIKRLMILAAAMTVIAAALPSRAVDLPVREVVSVTNTTPSGLVMPDFQGNGQLQRVQVVDDKLTNNTCVIKHLVKVPGTACKITNSVATVSYTTTWGASLIVTNGPYLFAGDELTYAFGTSSTGTVFNVRTLAK